MKRSSLLKVQLSQADIAARLKLHAVCGCVASAKACHLAPGRRQGSDKQHARRVSCTYCAGLNSNGMSMLPATGWPL
ncbi:hypothetical protein, partial [Xanthomonas euvesicatoria]|uniref:hypothetical protein n=1 Tax=Xanthomonas euvesicatoria TaxID=456327 RepID=UPI001C628DE3